MPIPGNTSSEGKKPTTPIIGTASAGNASASVAFTPSTYVGKGTITYTATSNPGGLTGSSATSPITVSSLTNGTAYTFSIVGTTNYGVPSDASGFSNSVTPVAPAPNFPNFVAPNFPNFPNFVAPNFPNFVTPNFPNFVTPNFPNFVTPDFVADPCAGVECIGCNLCMGGYCFYNPC